MFNIKLKVERTHVLLVTTQVQVTNLRVTTQGEVTSDNTKEVLG